MSLPASLSARGPLIEQAVEEWTKQLVELGGRNRLLFYRHLRVGTLDLSSSRSEVSHSARQSLLEGKKVRLSTLFPDDVDRPDALKRIRTIASKAAENFEERGIETLYLAWGMATWTPDRASSSKPASPVLLTPLEISRVGAAEQDYWLTRTGDPEINPTLLHFLETKFSSELDGDPIIEEWVDSHREGLDPSFVFEKVRAAASDVPQFRIADDVIVGNFSYAKLPMVRDLQQNLEALAANEIISAIAGDPDARRRITETRYDGELDGPDHIPPGDEFLILDADASQNYAISAALAGESLVIQGPPGTGKSQTIANLIGSLVSRGKRILFVAEKRAAIDAVMKRLEATGLSSLVMDLHGGTTSKRELAAQLGKALQAVSQTPMHDHSQLHEQLERERNELNGHVEAMHVRREPWDVSVYQLETGLLALGPCIEDVRLRAAELAQIDEPRAEELADSLSEYVAIGGLAKDEELYWSRKSVHTVEDATEATELLHTVRGELLPTATTSMRRLCKHVGLEVPQTTSDWALVLTLLARINLTLDTFTSEVFEVADSRELGLIIKELEPATGGLFRRATARVFSSSYRKASRDLRYVVKSEASSLVELRELLIDVVRQTEELQALGVTRVPERTSDAPDAASAFEQLMAGLSELAKYSPSLRLGDSDIEYVKKALDELVGALPQLASFPRLYELHRDLEDAGFGLLIQRLGDQPPEPLYAADSLWYTWMMSVYEAISLGDHRIGAFKGSVHSQRVIEFRNLDEQQVETSAERVARSVAEHAVIAQDRFPDEAQLVRAQAKRKRGHLPLRQLFRQAPHVVTALKPCWAMSPLLVSQLLPPNSEHFDVVIFDEASQVTPADAITSLLRAPQAIVAGDDRQLPPTMFFETGVDGEEDDDDGGDLTVGFQSILDVLNTILRPFTLTWHYRSEDERLIAFSNTYLYDRMLTTFPGPEGDECLRFVPVHEPTHRSAGASSQAEVAAVVRLTLDHARLEPELSLGVITMGISHANQIKEALRRALAEDDSLEGFFEEEPEEAFFIKNLERVQGDERDAIILTVGYGARNADGRLRYNFGPINQDGGERRLNVAVTRARRQLTLVSTFSHRDMDPARSSARGVELLRAYFAYVASNGSDLGGLEADPPRLNPFERAVKDRLTALGIPLQAQYGASGFRIDFAAAMPEKPGQFVLAIECDGASYHSSPTARDRDRLRQQILERMGWRFHRIWSTDWFRDPDREARRAHDSWETAVALAEQEETRFAPDALPPSTAKPEVEVSRRGRLAMRPDLVPRRPINSYPFGKLIELARWIESDTLLRTEDEVLAEMMGELGLKRRGRVIVDTLLRAIRRARAGQAGSSQQSLL